jgi:hypothetical protein
LTAWELWVVTTRTRFSPLRHFFLGETNRILPFSGLPFLMHRVIVPRPDLAASALVEAKRHRRSAMAATMAKVDRRRPDEAVIG